MSDDEIGNLANRLAMLVSDDGEADNAGRAVGALARRLGLSGGQLKAIFMAGAESAGVQMARLAEQSGRIQALEADLAQTREALRRVEASARSIQRERDALRGEADQLHEVLDQRRSSRTVRFVIGLIVVLALGGGAWLAYDSPQFRTTKREAATDGTPFYHDAVVHERNVALRRDPETDAPALAMLTEGTHLIVKRTLWHNLTQWVEVELSGQTGYVLSTEVTLS